TTMLSSAVDAVTVGFLRLFWRVTQAVVVLPGTVDDGILETKFPGVSEKPVTVKNVNAPPLCPEPPSQAVSTAAIARKPIRRPAGVDQRGRGARAASPATVRVIARAAARAAGCSDARASPARGRDADRGPAGRSPGLPTGRRSREA